MTLLLLLLLRAVSVALLRRRRRIGDCFAHVGLLAGPSLVFFVFFFDEGRVDDGSTELMSCAVQCALQKRDEVVLLRVAASGNLSILLVCSGCAAAEWQSPGWFILLNE